MAAVVIGTDGEVARGLAEVPEPRDGEVRLRVHAAAVNPTDLAMLTMGKMMTGVEGPWVPGMDAAGVIDAVGSESTFAVGERVMAVVVPYGSHTGAQAEYTVVPEASVIRLDEAIDFAAAATIPMNALTAVQALDEMNLHSDETVGVTGGAGHLATMFIRLARARGLRVIAEAAPADAEAVRSAGASAVIDRYTDVARGMRAAAPDGVAGVLDTALLNSAILPAIRDGGRLVSVRPTRLDTERGVEHSSILVPEYARNKEAIAAVADALEGGVIEPRVAQIYPLADVAEAYRRMARGGVRGRLVLDLA
ncbi:zinc-binding alcohol dehydrogenase family protein [Gordonia sp. VNK21]|uniref:quinone oxidoreductase family protein n=1 Tax=Gordonia sp. VNK21 TaxID=3382483 RepID=UPI0038D36D81